MDIDNIEGHTLKNLNKINIILGKNGCGKSSLLRKLDQHRAKISNLGKISYITPERSGILSYDAGIENVIISSPDNLRSQRNTNQFSQFKQQTVAQYRKLKDLIANEVEQHVEQSKTGTPATFGRYLQRLNTLLDEIELVRKDPTFSIVKKGSTDIILPEHISSGEAELIALGIESLVFEKEIEQGKTNLLLLDEPDVHLHPDLQVRLMHFIKDQIDQNDFKVIIATHSTAILGALESYTGVNIAFMKSGDKVLDFKPVNDIYRKILPMFGAHPLSNLFNEAPVLLVEGEDDERIWQQTVRTSVGSIKVYPCVCGNVNQIAAYEQEVKQVINSVYDEAKAYSLRDGDGSTGDMADDLPITKLKLQCYAAENLLLSDEVLSSLSTDWGTVKTKIEEWLTEKNGKQHPHYQAIQGFKDGGYNRKGFNIKDLRNDLMGIMGSDKPWEVVIGQVIGKLSYNDQTDYDKEGSVFNYLGEKLVKALLPKI